MPPEGGVMLLVLVPGPCWLLSTLSAASRLGIRLRLLPAQQVVVVVGGHQFKQTYARNQRRLRK
jgi:hypothetical protein